MPKRIVTELTDEQKAMLATYREKWKAISVEVEPINREKVAAVIKAAYAVSKFPEPEIVFFSNPFAAIKGILATENPDRYLGRNINCKFSKRVIDHLIDLMKQQIDKSLFLKLRNEVQFPDFYNPLDLYNTSFPYFPMGIDDCVRYQIAKD